MLPLKFIPQYFERVWGGRALETHLNRTLPPNLKIGESWELADRAGTCVSVVSEGEFAGKTLREILDAHGDEILGPGGAGARFPLIVKWLDCAASASIQVHPNAETAARFGEQEKTEAWYFFHSEDGAEFIAGLRAGTTADTLRRAIAAGTAESLVLHHRAAAGTAVLIRTGTVHTAGAGNVILEIQENSDSTFRLYDWNRRDSAGKLRELHVEKALASIDFEMNYALAGTSENSPSRAAPETPLCACAHFAMTHVTLGEGEVFDLPARGQPRLVTALTGTLKIAKKLSPLIKGSGTASAENAQREGSREEFAKTTGNATTLAAAETALLPFCGEFSIRSRGGSASFILTDNFYPPKTQNL